MIALFLRGSGAHAWRAHVLHMWLRQPGRLGPLEWDQRCDIVTAARNMPDHCQTNIYPCATMAPSLLLLALKPRTHAAAATAAGGIYGFDDVTVDGSLPGNFLGLKWSGLRVTNSQRFTACDGYSGFRHGVVSGPNVAYSLEVGAAGDLTNLVRITAPQPDKKFSVLGFAATAAWQVRRRQQLWRARCVVSRGIREEWPLDTLVHSGYHTMSPVYHVTTRQLDQARKQQRL